MAFPRDQYEKFVIGLFNAGATIFWKGEPEPFFTPIGDTPIIVKLDVGDSHGYGTSEARRIWVPEAQGGQGAYATYVLQRMSWPVTIDVETFDADTPGEDPIMSARGKLRWPSSIKAIQCMGLTTIRIGDVLSEIRGHADDRETFGAVLEVIHGQCYVSQAVDDDGNVIETIGSMRATLTGGRPDPIVLELGPIPPLTTSDDGDDNLLFVAPVNTPQSIGAGTRTLFNTYNLPTPLALRTPDASTDGNVFVTGDAGAAVETNGATLSDINGFQLENPLDGMFYNTLTWGPGSGGSEPNPNLPILGVYKWVRTTVALFAGTVTRWKLSW